MISTECINRRGLAPGKVICAGNNCFQKISSFPFRCQIYPHTKIHVVTIFLSKTTTNADIRLVFTSGGVGVVIRNVVKIKWTES